MVRALDAKGGPVSGVKVVFSVTAGGGLVADPEQTTDAEGLARVGHWTLGLLAGPNLLTARIPGTDISTTFGATTTNAGHTSPELAIGADGGVLTPALSGSGVDGLTITVPAGAYSSAANVQVSTAAVPALPDITGRRPIAPALRFTDGTAVTDSFLEIRVPVKSAADELVAAYWRDPATGHMEPAAVVASDPNSITVKVISLESAGAGRLAPGVGRATLSQADPSALAELIITSMPVSELLRSNKLTDFVVGQDDWEFENLGSVVTPNGSCLGQTLTMAWYYQARHQAGQPALNRRFAPARPIPELRWRDNAAGVRAAALVQRDYPILGGKGTLATNIWNATPDRLNWLLLLEALHVTQRPQLISVTYDGPDGRIAGGHALLAYAASPATGEVSIVDPNFPGGLSAHAANRRIKFNTGTGLYEAYIGDASADDAGDTRYTAIRYVPASALDWSKVAARWAEFDAAATAGGKVGASVFPAYSVAVITEDANRPYANGGMKLHDDSAIVAVAPAVSGAGLRVLAFDRNNVRGTAVDGATRVPLEFGSNDVGLYVYAIVDGRERFVDFQRIAIVRRPLRVVDDDGRASSSPLQFSNKVRRSFKLQFDDGSWPTAIDFSKITIAGQSNPRVTVTTSSTSDRFSLELSSLDVGQSTTQFDVLYRGRKVETLSAVVTVDNQRMSVASGAVSLHNCAVRADSTAFCWGSNSTGQLGDGSTTSRRTPVAVNMPAQGTKWTSLVLGSQHTCGLDATGRAFCWGNNSSGALGTGDLVNRSGPAAVHTTLTFASLTAGSGSTCGLTTAGTAYCWGFNLYGQLGVGDTVNRVLPAPVNGALRFASISIGSSHTCGLTPAGQAYCWGNNDDGEHGVGDTVFKRMSPVPVSGGLAFASITSGAHHNCALTAAGNAYCWGNGWAGISGDGNTSDHLNLVPVRVGGGLSFTRIRAGSMHNCALTADGSAYCWGSNRSLTGGIGGQLGSGAGALAAPTPVTGGLLFDELGLGFATSCATARNGRAYCWGDNFYGQLGNGSSANAVSPTPITDP